MLVVGTYRDTELDRRHPLTAMLADLRRDPDVTRVSLRGLDEPAVAAFVTETLDHELDASHQPLVSALHDKTGGNPFYSVKSSLTSSKQERRHQAEAEWFTEAVVADLDLPASVREVIGRRLDNLPDEVYSVLTVAAIAGHSFDSALVASVPEGAATDFEAALASAVSAGIVRLSDEHYTSPTR